MVCHFLSFIGLKCSHNFLSFSFFSFRLTFVSSSDHRLVSLLICRVCECVLALLLLLSICSIFVNFFFTKNSFAIPHTFTMWFESRFFCTWIVLLSLCTTFHVEHSTETESTERAFVASYDMCVSLSPCLCVCVCLCVWWMDTLDGALCSHFHAMHSRKAFASALRTVDNGFMLLLLLLSFCVCRRLLVLCFWFWCVQAHCPLFCRRQRSAYTFYTHAT